MLPQSGWPVTRQLLLSRLLTSVSLTGGSPIAAFNNSGAGVYRVHSMSRRSRLSPSSSWIGSASNASGITRRTPTLAFVGAPRQTAALTSARMRSRTSSLLADGVLVKLPRYSLNDLLSTMLGVSHGTVTCAIATCGLPRGVSHDS